MVISGCLLRAFVSELFQKLDKMILLIAWPVTTVFQCDQDTFRLNPHHWFQTLLSERESLLPHEINLMLLWFWFFPSKGILFPPIGRGPLYLPTGVQCACFSNACLPHLPLHSDPLMCHFLDNQKGWKEGKKWRRKRKSSTYAMVKF